MAARPESRRREAAPAARGRIGYVGARFDAVHWALERARAVLYPDESLPTGVGELSGAQRAWLEALHLL